MYQQISSLILYSSMPDQEILVRMGLIFRDLENHLASREELTHRLYTLVKDLLDLSTLYGFDRNLWQNYLTFLMISHENSFSMTCERTVAQHGSIDRIAMHDFGIFRQLLHYDFSTLEETLGTDCMEILCHYQAITKREQLFYRHVSEVVCRLSRDLDAAPDAETIYRHITDHFREHGVGLFGLNYAFRVQEVPDSLILEPVRNLDHVRLSDLIGYEEQKAALRQNVEAFLEGRPFNNTLLYGDAGTGKSTSVRALINEYAEKGLRIVEINKHQFHLLSRVISTVKKRNYRYILFLDDLSFEDHEGEYKFLKAVIEGGLESRPDNVMILATSNRRHLIRESWTDRADMEHDHDIHRSDTMQEKLSLAARFGCSISYFAPGHRLFQEIVKGLASRCPELDMPEDQLLLLANQYEMAHGGESGRTARQFIHKLLSRRL